jgi:hypothetical protein
VLAAAIAVPVAAALLLGARHRRKKRRDAAAAAARAPLGSKDWDQQHLSDDGRDMVSTLQQPAAASSNADISGHGDSGGCGSGQAGAPNSSGGGPGASIGGGGSGGAGSSAEVAGRGGTAGAVASSGIGNVSSMLKARSDMAVLRDLKIGPLLGRAATAAFTKVSRVDWVVMSFVIHIRCSVVC